MDKPIDPNSQRFVEKSESAFEFVEHEPAEGGDDDEDA